MKADRYHFIEDSKRCICADVLFQYSLFQAIGRFVEIDIAYNEFGKPFMSHINNFVYNLSHSGRWVVIAYGSTEVGVDIEEIQLWKNIADQFLAEEEKEFIYSATDKEQMKRFTQIWTMKESYIKYLGTGLATELGSFSVNAINGIVRNCVGEIQNSIKLKSYPFDRDYYLSVCGTEDTVAINEIMLEDLLQFINKINEGQDEYV